MTQNLPFDSFKITFAPLDLWDLYQRAETGLNGAIVLMTGVVRQETAGQRVVALEYQAYEPMALKVFETIAQTLRQRWPDLNRIIIHHRTGWLTVGEISVVVVVGAPHRAEAFAACQQAIDVLKHNAPIWKKEHWTDGSSTWISVGACEIPGEHLPPETPT